MVAEPWAKSSGARPLSFIDGDQREFALTQLRQGGAWKISNDDPSSTSGAVLHA